MISQGSPHGAKQARLQRTMMHISPIGRFHVIHMSTHVFTTYLGTHTYRTMTHAHIYIVVCTCGNTHTCTHSQDPHMPHTQMHTKTHVHRQVCAHEHIHSTQWEGNYLRTGRSPIEEGELEMTGRNCGQNPLHHWLVETQFWTIIIHWYKHDFQKD